MATTYQENDTSQICALNNFCSTVGGIIEAGRQAQNGATAGVTEVTFLVDPRQVDDNEFSFECILTAGTTGDAGNWVIRANFTTGQMDVTWESCSICRVSSACVNQETIGSATALGLATTAGVQSTTISGAAVTLAAGDKVIITLGFSNANTMFARTIGITPNQLIDSPFMPPAPAGPPVGSLAMMGVGR